MKNTIFSPFTRRHTLQGLAALGLGTVFSGQWSRRAAAQSTPEAVAIDDDAIFTFVLNLEYLEAEYYLRGTTGEGIPDADVGDNPGAVTGGGLVPFATDAIRQFTEEVAGTN